MLKVTPWIGKPGKDPPRMVKRCLRDRAFGSVAEEVKVKK